MNVSNLSYVYLNKFTFYQCFETILGFMICRETVA